ncbi:MAG TPA: hypothetical protein VN607_09315 [Gemmatimonadaceae bacterium]|nr:hypothetical protein [Gemmatimonadaceae bacterium]
MRSLILVLGFFVGAIGFTLGIREHDPLGLVFGVIGVAVFAVALFVKSFQ